MVGVRPLLAAQGGGVTPLAARGIGELPLAALGSGRVLGTPRRAAMIAANRRSGQRRGRPMISFEEYVHIMIVGHCCHIRGRLMSPCLQFTVSLSLSPTTLETGPVTYQDGQ